MGLFVKNANDNIVSNNTISNNYIGVGIENGDTNIFTNNIIDTNDYW